MKTISYKQVDSALFNLDSLRTKLMNERDDAFYEDEDKYNKLDERVEEVETLLAKMHFGKVSRTEWNRIQELVNERKMSRYITCLSSGMDEKLAAGAFED